MNTNLTRSICFTICVVCIVSGLVLGLAMIWDVVNDAEFAYRVFMTLCLFFISALLTLSVTKYFAEPGGK